MIKKKTTIQRLLPLALVPLFSVAVLAGCSSDDDDGLTVTDSGTADVDTDTDADTDTATDTDTVVDADANGNGVPDAFESTDPAEDANGNGIIDSFETPTDPVATLPADVNENGVDDSFEADLTSDVDDGDTDAVVEPIDQTGAITSALGDFGETSAGDLALVWDGSTLTGQVNATGNVAPASAGLFAGIAASGIRQQIVPVNGGPTFFLPSSFDPIQSAAIQQAIIRGGLFVEVEFVDGSAQDALVQLPGVQPSFTALSGDVFSNGEGFLNVNTVTGDFITTVNINLDGSDLDAAGVPQTVTAVEILSGAAEDATGTLVVALESVGNGSWSAAEQLSTAELSSLLEGNTFFNVLSTSGESFLTGQISIPQ